MKGAKNGRGKEDVSQVYTPGWIIRTACSLGIGGFESGACTDANLGPMGVHKGGDKDKRGRH